MLPSHCLSERADPDFPSVVCNTVGIESAHVSDNSALSQRSVPGYSPQPCMRVLTETDLIGLCHWEMAREVNGARIINAQRLQQKTINSTFQNRVIRWLVFPFYPEKSESYQPAHWAPFETIFQAAKLIATDSATLVFPSYLFNACLE